MSVFFASHDITIRRLRKTSGYSSNYSSTYTSYVADIQPADIDRVGFGDGGRIGTLYEAWVNSEVPVKEGDQLVSQSGGDEYQSGVFNGATNFLSFPNLDITASFSVGCWIKADTNSINTRIIDCQDTGPANGFALLMPTSTSVKAMIYNGANFEASVTANIEINKWIHVAFTYEPNDFKMYINGVLFGTDTLVTMTLPAVDLFIGKRAGLNLNNPFKGNIDNFFYANRELSATDIYQIYQSNKLLSDMKCKIDFDGNFNDDSGNGNYGQNYNSTPPTFSSDVPYGADPAIATQTYSVKSVNYYRGAGLLDHKHLVLVAQDAQN